jgi:protocatechuate 3,4-dioxygenase beta subunit
MMLLLLGCSRPPTGTPASEGDVQLAPPDEPGQRLTVTGVLVRAEDQTPVPDHRFRIYQADAAGDYRARDPSDERTARLSADVTTDSAGRFVIRTILPGVYGNPPGDPHLHIEVSGAQPAAHVVYFEGFLQESTIRWQKTTEQAHIIPVTRGKDGAISGHLTLPVRGLNR